MKHILEVTIAILFEVLFLSYFKMRYVHRVVLHQNRVSLHSD